MIRSKTAITFAALLLWHGCGDQTGVPQPIPIPGQVRAMSAPAETAEAIDLVGLPGAVAGAGRVFVDGATTSVEARSTAAGSFSATIKAKGGEQLSIRYEDSDAARLDVPAQGIMAPRPPGPITGVTPVSVPAAGVVTVRGLSNGAGVALVAVNANTGVVAQATSGADSRFLIKIAGASGHGLKIYEDANGMLSSAWSLTVPW